MPEYIYLILLREFLTQKKSIYKIGKTKQVNATRFNNYPKGSELQFQIKCNDCDNFEKKLIDKFKKEFIQKKEYGNEYFEGDCNKMINIIFNSKNITKNIITNKYKCKLCKKDFRDRSNYNRHINRKHSCVKTEFKCNKCNKILNSLLALQRHINKKMSCDNNIYYKCDICNKQYISINYYYNHIKLIHQNKS